LANEKTRMYLDARAALRLMSDDLDPSEVTRMLELPPDRAHRKGDLRITRSKSGSVVTHGEFGTGMWSMSSGVWVSSPKLTTHLEWILEQIRGKGDALARLRAAGVSGDVSCYSLGRTTTPPPLPRAIEKELGDLGLSVEIDHYEA